MSQHSTTAPVANETTSDEAMTQQGFIYEAEDPSDYDYTPQRKRISRIRIVAFGTKVIWECGNQRGIVKTSNLLESLNQTVIIAGEITSKIDRDEWIIFYDIRIATKEKMKPLQNAGLISLMIQIVQQYSRTTGKPLFLRKDAIVAEPVPFISKGGSFTRKLLMHEDIFETLTPEQKAVLCTYIKEEATKEVEIPDSLANVFCD